MQNTGGSLQIAGARWSSHLSHFSEANSWTNNFSEEENSLSSSSIASGSRCLFWHYRTSTRMLKWVVNYDLTLKAESLSVFCFFMKKSRKVYNQRKRYLITLWKLRNSKTSNVLGKHNFYHWGIYIRVYLLSNKSIALIFLSSELLVNP